MSITSTTVSGDVIQKNVGPIPPPPTPPPVNLVYAPYGDKCSLGSCDFNTDLVPCDPGDIPGPLRSCQGTLCAEQYSYCIRVNPAVCPTFSSGAVTGTAAWTAVPGTLLTDYSKSVTCTYNTSDIINNPANVATWNSAFGANDSYNDTIMPNFCIQQSDTCPNFPAVPGAPTSTLNQLNSNGTVTPVCSNFLDTGTSGSLCRAWALANPDAAQTAYSNYCLANNTPDCSCVSRANNSVYESIKTAEVGQKVFNEFNDGCWYLPCANSTYFLIPSDINPTSDCATEVCQQVQNFIDSGGTINVGPINESTNCNFSSPTGSQTGNTGTVIGPTGGGGGGGGGGGTTGGQTGGTSGTTGPSIWSKYKWAIIGTIIAVLLIVIIFVFLNSRHKKPVPKAAVKKKEG